MTVSSSDQATETDPDESRGITGTVTPSPVQSMYEPVRRQMQQMQQQDIQDQQQSDHP